MLIDVNKSGYVLLRIHRSVEYFEIWKVKMKELENLFPRKSICRPPSGPLRPRSLFNMTLQETRRRWTSHRDLP